MTESRVTSASGETAQLGKGLQVRHPAMMGLGSAIGAGLFFGTGVGIKAAGPGVLIPYVIADFIIIPVMQILGGMAAACPTPGSFFTCAEMALGLSANFVLGWLYWFILIMVLNAEITGAGAVVGTWFGVPGRIPGLACVVSFTVVNLANVRDFDEFEFWFAFIKVAVIIVFLAVGVLLFFGLLPGTNFADTTRIAESGFLPNGVFGIAAGLLAVAFAFGSIEIVMIVAAETEDPQRSVAAAVRSVIFRISVFCLDYMAVIILLLPYSQINGVDSAAESPFAQVLRQTNVPDAVGFMEAIIILALLSAFNAQIHVTSHLVYSMSTRGEAPRFFAHTNEDAVLNRVVIMSTVSAFVSVDLQVVFDGSSVLVFLLNAVDGCLLVIQLVITPSKIKLWPQMEANNELSVRMWAYPTLSWVTVILTIGLAVGTLIDPDARQQVITAICVTAFLVVLAALTKRNRTTAHGALESSDGN